jgi:hypothetical protein
VLASFPNGLPLDEVHEWLTGIVAGVTYLHDRGIVHRDLKPANIYRENGAVKVGDVGLSKRLGSDRRAAHTQSVGTVYYMAPEVANGQYGPGVDVYSLGVMLFELLTGKLPFTGETTGEVLMKHLTATPNLSMVIEPLRPVVSRALLKDPQQRTPSVLQVEQEFREALSALRRSGNMATLAPRMPLAETPSSAADAGRRADTAKAIPVGTKAAAQVASAYAQYPPEVKAPPPRVAVTVKQTGPKAVPRTRPATVKSKHQSAYSQMNWVAIATFVVGLLLFAPGTWRSWTGLGMIAAAIATTAVLRGKNGRGLECSQVAIDPAVEVQVCTTASESRQALADTAASLTVGSVSASLLSIGALLTTEFFLKSPLNSSPEYVAMFTTTSLASTWLILMASQGAQHWTWLRKNPRKSFLVLGLAAGSIAYVVDQYLLVDYAKPGWSYFPAFSSLGVHRLMDGHMNPTYLGYLVFFGGLFFWYRWWQDTSDKRSRQLSMGRVATAAVAAWLLTVVFAFPQWPAVLWAMTISASVQLASTWCPPDRRAASRRC